MTVNPYHLAVNPPVMTMNPSHVVVNLSTMTVNSPHMAVNLPIMTLNPLHMAVHHHPILTVNLVIVILLFAPYYLVGTNVLFGSYITS
jgi:hypothetical protein